MDPYTAFGLVGIMMCLIVVMTMGGPKPPLGSGAV